MQLYLVQHGAAKSEAEDPQRSLTAEGTKTVERMIEYLSSLKVRVARIEHSCKERARQTAEQPDIRSKHKSCLNQVSENRVLSQILRL